MVLPDNIPSEAPANAAQVLRERLPNYCHDCGNEIVVAGGRIEPESGWYDHLDPVLMCSDGCWQDRFTAGLNQSEGQEYRIAPGSQSHDDKFPNAVGYCDIHREKMTVTKDLMLHTGDETRPVRQFKCPECDRETTITTVE